MKELMPKQILRGTLKVPAKPITIKYTPHEGQKPFHQSKHRVRILVAGVRGGKTVAGLMEAVYYAGRPRSLIWWVAPYLETAKKAQQQLIELVPRELFYRVTRTPPSIQFINGSLMEFKSADNPEGLLGVGLDLLVIDEAASIKEDIWQSYLRPRLSDPHRLGHAIFIGTPKGINWFYKLYLKGQLKSSDPNYDPNYKSWKFPTWQNPYIKKREITQAQKDLPPQIFAQEYGAEFIEQLGSIFGDITPNIQGALQPPRPGATYYAGVDFGKEYSYTAITILNQQGHLDYFERFRKQQWTTQLSRVVKACQRYRATLLVDATGLGDPLYDHLRNTYPNTHPYKITAQTKAKLIENLQLALAHQEITFPDIPELTNELKIFGSSLSKTGQPQLTAPKGFTDDCVIALALAAWQFTQRKALKPSIEIIEL